MQNIPLEIEREVRKQGEELLTLINPSELLQAKRFIIPLGNNEYEIIYTNFDCPRSKLFIETSLSLR